jgi:Protein of unknown function (DUF3311)
MVSTYERYAWGLVFVVLVVFAVPWFLWGDARVIRGLPVWLWWHVGWMGLASFAFWLFSRRAWGLWIEGTT